MSLHLGALSNLRNWDDEVSVVINRYSVGFEDSLSLNDSVIVVLNQASLIGKSFSDSLNNWQDSFSSQVGGNVNIAVTIGDNLNQWDDALLVALTVIHYKVNLVDTLSISDNLDKFGEHFKALGDTLNTWNDVAARSPTTLEQSQVGIVDIIVFDDFVEILLQEVPPLIRFAHICWSDEYLKRIENDAIDEIMREVEYKWERFSLDITNGVGLYNLPDYLISITAVTWKGKPLLPLTPSELEEKDPLYRTTTGEPKYYTRYGDGPYKLRLSPIPNEILVAATADGLLGSEINTSFIVSCYRKRSSASNAINIPDYIGRRTLKPYILEKAFRKEGKCQNLKASQYYKAKYEMLMSLFKSIQSNYYTGREPISNNLTANRRPQYARLADDFTIHS